MLCVPMFEAPASGVDESRRSKSGTVMDKDKRGHMKGVVVGANLFLNRFFLAWMLANYCEEVYWCALQVG